MANCNFRGVQCHSTSRPHFFDGNDTVYWKFCMRICFQSINYDLCLVLQNEPHISTHIVKEVKTLKTENEYDDFDKKQLTLGVKATNIIMCALYKNEYSRITSCSNARDIQCTLEVTHNGTSQIKEYKIDILVHEYDMFKMKSE